jgi:hypothetical protein
MDAKANPAFKTTEEIAQQFQHTVSTRREISTHRLL